MRSVFVSQLSNRVDDRMLANFFENVVQVGVVREAKVIVDRISRRSKGCVFLSSLDSGPTNGQHSVGYVEFRDVGTVTKALAASGTKLLGIPMKIEYTEAEKNRLAMASNAPANGPLHIPMCVHFSLLPFTAADPSVAAQAPMLAPPPPSRTIASTSARSISACPTVTSRPSSRHSVPSTFANCTRTLALARARATALCSASCCH
jgi:hypothetical protein